MTVRIEAYSGCSKADRWFVKVEHHGRVHVKRVLGAVDDPGLDILLELAKALMEIKGDILILDEHT